MTSRSHLSLQVDDCEEATRQALEEKFILDVLEHYADYDAYYRLVKQAADDPEFPKRPAAAALAKFMGCTRTTSRRRPK